MQALLECFSQYDIVIFLLSASNSILVLYLWQLKLTSYTYQDLLFANSHRNMYYVLRYGVNKGNNKITELRTILQRESQNS
jgi:hypothetical protein